MRNLEQVREKVKQDLESEEGKLMVALCDAHPLMYFLQEYYQEEYRGDVVPYTWENLIEAMREYFSFAMSKAKEKRGISSERSIWKYKQWLWALGDDELLSFLKDDFNYHPYGLPMLKRIGEKYGFKEDATE